MSSSPEDLQALIDALAFSVTFCPRRSVTAKTKMIIVLVTDYPAATFSCSSWRGAGHWTQGFTSIEAISLLITPLSAETAGSWSVMLQRNSQMQSGSVGYAELHSHTPYWCLPLAMGVRSMGVHSPAGALA